MVFDIHRTENSFHQIQLHVRHFHCHCYLLEPLPVRCILHLEEYSTVGLMIQTRFHVSCIEIHNIEIDSRYPLF